MMIHRCHAYGCDKRVPPRMLMCREHWELVPPPIKRAVLKAYRPGQCKDKRPSAEWLIAARAAIKAVEDTEAFQRMVAGPEPTP